MGYRLNRLDEPILIAVSKPLLTEFDIHHRLESCTKVVKVMWKISTFNVHQYPKRRLDMRPHLGSFCDICEDDPKANMPVI